jgi:hypothetical protein
MQTTAVNEAPTITGPTGTPSIPFNGSFVFSGSQRISVSDVDAPNPRMKVVLDGWGGQFTLSTKNDLTFQAGDGTNDT